MADIYKFKVKLIKLEDVIWRDIEITSVSNVAKLGYSIMVAFECDGSHLFSIRHNGKLYEILYDNYLVMEPTFDPIKTKLSSLKMAIGDVLTMKYDYGAGWTFSLELIEIFKMEPNTGYYYPHVADGRGRGIMENTSPAELLEAVDYTDKTGEVPTAVDLFSGKEKEWDYRQFIVEFCNGRMYGGIMRLRNSYER